MYLFNTGLRHNSDVWVVEHQRILPSAQVAARFGLLPTEFHQWELIRARLTNTGSRLMRQQSSCPQPDEWLGLYNRLTDPLPTLVFQGHSIPEARLNGTATTVPLVRVPDGFEVLSRSHTLCHCFLRQLNQATASRVSSSGCASPPRKEGKDSSQCYSFSARLVIYRLTPVGSSGVTNLALWTSPPNSDGRSYESVMLLMTWPPRSGTLSSPGNSSFNGMMPGIPPVLRKKPC
jgi:hypothetical protein